MVKIRILERPISIGLPDTNNTHTAEPGDIEDVTAETAQEFVGRGRAEYVKEPDPPKLPHEVDALKASDIDAAAKEPEEAATAERQRTAPRRRSG